MLATILICIFDFSFDVRGQSGDNNLCSSITPILPPGPNPLDGGPCVMMPLLPEIKKIPSPHRHQIISPLLQHGGKNMHNRRFLPNNCSGMKKNIYIYTYDISKTFKFLRN